MTDYKVHVVAKATAVFSPDGGPVRIDCVDAHGETVAVVFGEEMVQRLLRVLQELPRRGT